MTKKNTFRWYQIYWPCGHWPYIVAFSGNSNQTRMFSQTNLIAKKPLTSGRMIEHMIIFNRFACKKLSKEVKLMTHQTLILNSLPQPMRMCKSTREEEKKVENMLKNESIWSLRHTIFLLSYPFRSWFMIQNAFFGHSIV